MPYTLLFHLYTTVPPTEIAWEFNKTDSASLKLQQKQPAADQRSFDIILTQNETVPPDEELRKILLDFERRSLSRAVRLRYLEEDHQILTTLKTLNRKFKIPSSRKFEAVEEATAAIADIIARDVHQGQGPDTVKKIASLRLNLTIPRDFVRATMKGLVGQKPSDMRRP
ncbi:hypothetical protein B0H14DRAFT_3177799, partial [Mycena olivaceomarginata]